MDFAQLAQILLDYRVALEWLTVGVAIVIFVSSVDDFFIDVYYWIRRARRRLFVRTRHPRLPIAKLTEKPEEPIAIMVPAWKESDVIASMLWTNIELIRYRNYHFFVGTYQNDPATAAEVAKVAAHYPNVHCVRVPHDGPTCKADCLNSIIAGIRAYEKENGTEFVGIAMHDAEDIIHPLELRFFNFLIGRKDLIQLPIFSLRCSPRALVAGTYMDEFAEWHSKDLVVRESMTGTVPCAGVAACFSRRAIQALSDETGGEPFNTSTLTEDYDIAFRLKKLGMKEVFVRFSVKEAVESKRGGGLEVIDKPAPIATKEYFPSAFVAAYRQRARWILGIAFHGWKSIGWRASWPGRYFLLRDRKTIITSPANMIAMFLVLQFMFVEAALGLLPSAPRIATIFETSSTMQTLMAINFIFLLLRLFHRVFFTAHIYGGVHGLLAIPRLLVSNLINYFAVSRAIGVYVDSMLTGRKIAWDKTTHTFPTGHGSAMAKPPAAPEGHQMPTVTAH
jgi:adsorption protein B